MDLTQVKLSKAEWTGIEVPVSDNEKMILQVIIDGFSNCNIKYNNNKSLFQLMKMTNDGEEIHSYFFKEYFVKEIDATLAYIHKKGKPAKKSDKSDKKGEKEGKKGKEKDKKENKGKGEGKGEQVSLLSPEESALCARLEQWKVDNMDESSIKKMKKGDIIRIEHMNEQILVQRPYIFEYVLMDFCHKILISLLQSTNEYGFYLYTLLQFRKNSIANINTIVTHYVNFVIDLATSRTDLMYVFSRSYEFIEKNKYLLNYEDIQLFSHQKQLFSIFKLNSS